MRYALPLAVSLLAVAVLALAGLSAADSARAQIPFFQTCGNVQLESAAPDQSSDITSVLGLGIGADCRMQTDDDDRDQYQFGGIIDFIPPEWGVAEDGDIVDGSGVGTHNTKMVF